MSTPEKKVTFAISQGHVPTLLDAINQTMCRAEKAHSAAFRKSAKNWTPDNIGAEETTMEWLHMLRELDREIHQCLEPRERS